ncbi:MAG TPA: serine hydrolase domain-containing protein [Planctomycetota bacterium]|nr:serine hydrolase domain-containing protein [Planctomycetota bacterium]
MRTPALLVFVFALAVPSPAQVEVPETPAGRQFTRWFDLFNRGEKKPLEDFLEANHPSGRARAMQFRDMTGGFDLVKVEDASAPTKLAGIVKERDSSTYGRFELEVEAAEPHKFSGFRINVIPRPADIPPPPRLTEEEAITLLRSTIEKAVAADRFSGAVALAKGGKTVFSGAWGLADRERKEPNRVDTRFRIGSMNKMFTAVATAQLAQAGKLAFTDSLGTHLTEYPNHDVASKVTIHHLLTHTGGTGDIFGPQFEEKRKELRELADYLALYGERALQFEPGSRWSYSNYGFLLLGLLVEKVGGQSYYEYVRKNVFEPAAMTRTDSLAENEDVPGRSTGYMRSPDGWKPNTDTLPWRGTSAGGGYSTVEDLVRFAQALLGHKLLDGKHTELVTTGKVATRGESSKYAYGFFDTVADGVRWFGHGGGAPGMNGELRIYPDSGYIVAVLVNLDPPAASRIADALGERLPAK